jgi:hypothetical protein
VTGERKTIPMPPEITELLEKARRSGHSSVRYDDWDSEHPQVDAVFWESGEEENPLARAILDGVPAAATEISLWIDKVCFRIRREP